MEWIDHFLTELSNFLWGWPMIIMLLGTHVFLTIRLRFPQRHIFKAIRLSVKRDPNADVSSDKQYTHLWQFIYEFVFCIIAVGLVEELVFRGTIYEYAKRIFGSDIGAVILSSLLFGAFHILRGNIAQLFVTAFIGALFCLFRLKIKNCSLLSLIIAHGIYDALIVVWTFVFGK